jgi:hypothetical protein
MELVNPEHEAETFGCAYTMGGCRISGLGWRRGGRGCRYWTEAFANPKADAVDEKVERIVEMGFDRAAAVQALQRAGGDENAALEQLLGGA